MSRAYNFSAGPAAIPEIVLKRVKEELLEWNGQGASVMEISHRCEAYLKKILEPAEENLRKLMNIPKNYHVLFISATTSHQFSMIPMNLLDCNQHNKADYFHTGLWSGKAIKEAERYGKINIALSSEENNFTNISSSESWRLDSEASYLHYTPNETVHGLEFNEIPMTGKVPLVADMSSMILSRNIDVNRFGLIYAGSQKNIGPTGLTIVIIREDLVGKAKSFTPNLYNYQTYVEYKSLFNTPATFSIYLASLCFEWLIEQGGVSEIEKINARKAKKLYDYIDQTDFYRNHINPQYRSKMNVVFYLPTPELELLFVKESNSVGLINLKGHKVIGGIRASIYNAMPESGVETLVNFMKDFEKRNG
jgi:phosphoserine aminotransferase